MASQAYQYNGREFSLSRDQTRFALPAKFRKIVRDSSDSRSIMCLDQHHRWPCLIGFGLSRANAIPDLLDSEALEARDLGKDFDRELREMQLNAFDTVPFDDSGRFVLPPYLGEIAKVSDELYFQGSGPVLLIWSPVNLYAMEGAEWRAAQAACRQLSADARAKAAKA